MTPEGLLILSLFVGHHGAVRRHRTWCRSLNGRSPVGIYIIQDVILIHKLYAWSGSHLRAAKTSRQAVPKR